MILNSILIEIQKVSKISTASERKTKISALYEELVSIQFELKKFDLYAYKASLNLIKNLHANSSNIHEIESLIVENDLIIDLVLIPCQW